MTALDGVQGNVLIPYGTSHADYLFVNIADAAAARDWLSAQLGRVTAHRSGTPSSSDVTFNLAFSHRGLLALGVPPVRLAHLEAFSAGMAARHELLGDLGASAPERWEPGLRDSHLLIILSAHDAELLDRLSSEVNDSLAPAGLGLAHRQDAHALPEGRDHFGFQDGFSQPAIAGLSDGARVGEGTLTWWRRWRRLALGEFVLGNTDEGGCPPPAPLGPLGDDATFMVIRKLAQDVAAFRRFTRDAAVRLGREPDWVAAKMVGRWQNGSALARHPHEPGPPADGDPKVSSFGYRDDLHGYDCPVGAHVRRANPRDSLDPRGQLTQRHRIIRRGMRYGPPLSAGSMLDDGSPRGLMFVAYQAAIERQFEFIQSQWLGDGNALRIGGDRDPIVADGESRGEMVIQGRPPAFLTGLPRFVTTLGGDYYLVPGIAGLAALAAGAC